MHVFRSSTAPSQYVWRLLVLIVIATSLLLLSLAHPLRTHADSPDTADPELTAPAAEVSLTPEEEMEAAMFERINQIRASYGLAPFTRSADLDEAAGNHVSEGAARGWLSHKGVNGSSYYTRVAATGYDAIKVNECIGWGYSLDRMINWWMNSYTHRNILLSSYYTDIGIGYEGVPSSSWKNWWVVKAARPAQ